MLAAFRPEAAKGVSDIYEFRIGDEVLQARVENGALALRQGSSHEPDLTFATDARTLRRILSRQLTLADAVSQDRAQMQGDPSALARCDKLFGLSVAPA